MMRYSKAKRMGDEGVMLLERGKLKESRERLELSLALWERDEIQAALGRVNDAVKSKE